uniref:ABM domain-containing protein n=1 Tax=OCS116 cluster bacterium TaxID=2030921 RepID=A0A2A4YTD6_9PROT
MGRIVIVGYKPKPGKQAELVALMKTHLPVLREAGLVTERESIIMQAEDASIIEVFEWKSKAAMNGAHEHASILKMWADYEACCTYIPVAELPEISSLFSEFTPLN